MERYRDIKSAERSAGLFLRYKLVAFHHVIHMHISNDGGRAHEGQLWLVSVYRVCITTRPSDESEQMLTHICCSSRTR